MQKLHNNHHAPGLEWKVLKKMPLLLAASVLIPGIMLLISHGYPFQGLPHDIVRLKVGIDFIAISIFITAISFLIAIGILCFTIHLMKGPAYVADAYPLNDADEPDQDSG
jgi:di/tricarboxylate transporter